jgi:pyruvate/2-oxoacid:ferredoxin oxidoreductase alpha subunit
MTGVEAALETARVAVLLVSGRFFASHFITTVELPRLLSMAQSPWHDYRSDNSQS